MNNVSETNKQVPKLDSSQPTEVTDRGRRKLLKAIMLAPLGLLAGSDRREPISGDDATELVNNEFLEVKVDGVLENEGYHIEVKTDLLMEYLHECLDYYEIDSTDLSKFYVYFTTSIDGIEKMILGSKKTTLGIANPRQGTINIFVKTQIERISGNFIEIDSDLISLYLTLTLVHEIDHLLSPYSQIGKQQNRERTTFFASEFAKHSAIAIVWSIVMAVVESKLSEHQYQKFLELLEGDNYSTYTKKYQAMTRRVFLGRAVVWSALAMVGAKTILNMRNNLSRYYEIDPTEESARNREQDFLEDRSKGIVIDPEDLLVRINLPKK